MDPAQIFSNTSGNPPAPAHAPADTGLGGSGSQQGIDANELQNALQHFQSENENLKGELGSLKGRYSEDAKLLDGMKKLFSPAPEDPGMDEKTRDEQFLDMVLDSAMKSREAGTGGMPITVQLAAQLVQQRQQARDLQKTLAEMKGKVDRHSDPRFEAENRALLSMDTMAQNMLENIYGSPQPELFNAAGSKMVASAKQIQAEAPDKWAQIIRTPGLQQKFVQYHIESVVPPKARDILHRDKIQNEDMPVSELLRAREEAKQLMETGKLSRDEYQKIATEIRQKVLEEGYLAAGGRRR